MKFKANTRRRALEYEKDLVQQWKKNKTFEKSIEQRPIENSYVFYDGPPFITGVPHHGTLLSSIVKDTVPRYWTMKGKRVERVWGWDCHGLPAEVFTEKKLGIQDRRDIGTKISLEEYITTARDNMVQTSSLWNDTIDRIGRWVDMDKAYKTMDKEYMESIWWAFKTLHEKGKIYEGERVLMYCTRDATPLSKAEVTMDTGSYQDVTDPSVYVKFKLKDFKMPEPITDFVPDNSSEKERQASIERTDEVNGILRKYGDLRPSLLAWTTTPWTLPANTAIAVNKSEQYSLVFVGGEWLIMASDRVEKVMQDEKHHALEFTVFASFSGSEFLGMSYEPLFGVDRGKNAHKVWAADYVSSEDGTGIVHLAPAYGEEDFEHAQREGIPVVHVIDENGLYSETEWKGENVWEINKTIAKTLHERGVVWKIDYIRHPYPHCHRCGTRLMYRAHPSWFFDVQGQKQLMLEKNGEQINWFPDHLKHGRWEKNIEQAPDWNLSRDRFWATAMPVWEGVDKKGKKHQIVVGSYAELKELSGVELDDYHRPWIDDVTFEKDGVHYKRIEKVLDGWFESGSMSFAQFHYPFENKEKFEANFPGDFIVEYIGQVRAWFYYMHVVSVGLFGESAFKNVIATGTLAGNDGRKMSKSYGNFTDPNELMDTYSADAERFLLLSSPVLNGEDFSLQDKDVGDVARKLSMVWNMYDFFTMYAEVDNFTFPYSAAPSDAFLVHGMSNTAHSDTSDSLHNNGTENLSITVDIDKLKNPLDIWIISRVHQLTQEVEKHMDGYDIPNALKPVLPFIEDASNWYVRRSRRRFWKSEDDTDKNNAYRTLHYVFVQLAQVLAPFTPFLAEELYQKLTGGESVHLLDWPKTGHINELVVKDMETVREYVNQALAIRAKERVKIRQPLASVTVPSLGQFVNFEDILTEELNVKKVVQGKELALDLKITPALRREGLMREVIRHVQAARKDAGLNVDDRIQLSLTTDDADLQKAIAEHEVTIKAEALATDLTNATYSYQTTAKVEGAELKVSLEKAS